MWVPEATENGPNQRMCENDRLRAPAAATPCVYAGNRVRLWGNASVSNADDSRPFPEVLGDRQPTLRQSGSERCESRKQPETGPTSQSATFSGLPRAEAFESASWQPAAGSETPGNTPTPALPCNLAQSAFPPRHRLMGWLGRPELWPGRTAPNQWPANDTGG